ncbi:MAG: tRNA 4-thiouridine(8) synthase ThiI [Proteobacteria bacterium]|nr:tRNA 4-thiouridine(8) synthase ThiI [Pseudomonadota bacterium]
MTHTEPSPEAAVVTRDGPPLVAVIRWGGEVAIKAPATRRRFLDRLVRALADVLHKEGLSPHIERGHARCFARVETPAQAQALARVFGVQSVSLAHERPWQSLDDLVAAGVELFGAAVAGRRFAVRARRVGDRSRVPVSSQDLAVRLGDALRPRSAGVDLSHPEVEAHVEILAGRAYFFREAIPGPAGLPIGVEGHAVALVSGGFDSAVAAWQLQRRGVDLDYVFCNLGGRAHQLGTLRVMDVIARRWSYGARPHFHAIDFEELSAHLQAETQPRYWQVLLKRLMLRAADAVARERGALGIVTGEAVGQVSSQTLANLAVISRATELPILRPLVGLNKDEIIAQSKAIGTYELSKVVGEYCALVPSKPATAASEAVVQEQEARLNPGVLERAVAERSVFDLRALDLASLEVTDLEIDAIPAGATVLDLRSKPAYASWHYRDALFLDFASALAAYEKFDREPHYVLYCEFGLKSAHLAERMRDAGFDAHHVQGGLRRVVQLAREAGDPTPFD